jgi:hypothetical protein
MLGWAVAAQQRLGEVIAEHLEVQAGAVSAYVLASHPGMAAREAEASHGWAVVVSWV